MAKPVFHHAPYPHDHDDDPTTPGVFAQRAGRKHRDYGARSFTVGIGGPVGSGKTALLLALCRALRDRHQLGVVTNDIFTKEDAEFLMRHEALPAERIRAVETGGCPHTAIRDDISPNLVALDGLMESLNPELLFVESGGDKIPRKGGPGITQSDLLIINKTDLAPLVGADLGVMERDARKMRGEGPFLFTQVKNNVGVADVVSHVTTAWEQALGRVGPEQETRR